MNEKEKLSVYDFQLAKTISDAFDKVLPIPKVITINPDYEKLLPTLSKEEYEALKNSIKEEGMHFPIIINVKGEILDGHHRFRICKELGIGLQLEDNVLVKYFVNPLEEKKFVIESNLKRRQLNPLDATQLGIVLEEIEGELAKQRMGQKDVKDGEVVSFETGSQGRAGSIAAKKIGLSATTYHRAKAILEKGTPELQDKVRKGNESVFGAYKIVMQREHGIQPSRVEIPNAAEGLPQELFITNIWRLPESRPKGYGSSDFRGNCDPTIIDQCLRRYVMNPHVPEDARILDPMAGSGTFIDVASKLGFSRESILAYDLNKKREDIQEIQDAVNLPLDDGTIDFVFCHYPYYNMWKYSDKPKDFSNCDYGEFLRRVSDSFKEFRRILKRDSYLCVLIGNKRESGLIDIESDVSRIGRDVFGHLWDKIITIVGEPAGHAHAAHGNWGLIQHRSLKDKWTVQNYDALLVFRKRGDKNNGD